MHILKKKKLLAVLMMIERWAPLCFEKYAYTEDHQVAFCMMEHSSPFLGRFSSDCEQTLNIY
jgi:hypothetical protein